MQYVGKCLCKAVTFSMEAETSTFGACHCSMCRRWGGGPLLAVHGESVKFESTESISTFESSDWAERGFCSNCGTHLFYRLKGKPFYAVSLGCLEEAEELSFKSQIFIDSKPDNYEFSNDTYNLTEAQVLETFSD